MRLSSYLSETGIDDATFGALVGLNRSSVSRIRRGKQRPSDDKMREIFRATGGAVTPNDFLGVAA